MTNKAPKPFGMAPLQKLTVKPIEDPAEQAALDERLKRSQEAVSALRAPGGLPSQGTAPGVLELCCQLSAAERLRVATELTAPLSLDERIELMEHLAAHLPPEVIRHLEERRRGRAGRVGDGGSDADGTRRG